MTKHNNGESFGDAFFDQGSKVIEDLFIGLIAELTACRCQWQPFQGSNFVIREELGLLDGLS